jgi:hypothetical protein
MDDRKFVAQWDIRLLVLEVLIEWEIGFVSGKIVILEGRLFCFLLKKKRGCFSEEDKQSLTRYRIRRDNKEKLTWDCHFFHYAFLPIVSSQTIQKCFLGTSKPLKALTTMNSSPEAATNALSYDRINFTASRRSDSICSTGLRIICVISSWDIRRRGVVNPRNSDRNWEAK